MTENLSFNDCITDFETAYATLITVAESYPDDLQTQAGVCGTWSARELIAHLCGWIVEALRRYPRYALSTGDIDYNTDAFNEVSIWLRREKGYDSIVSELRDSSAKLAQFARDLPESQIERNGQRYMEWLTSLTREAREHSAQLKDFAS
ncbi:MAG: maleylpyruvate isomerase N-terminal domain-containing protein [Anaerolineae bacterium]|nr:maleylpyruvate isomerase N-terminal domain-containing protein [Anaerolineae bacterium]